MSEGTASYVLDSFPVMALVYEEPAAPRVNQLMEMGATGRLSIAMSVVKWGEVLYGIGRRSGWERAVRAVSRLEDAGVEIVEADRDLAYVAARLKASHRMAYGDCYAAALAMQRAAVLVTGDLEFRSVEGAVRIEWLPQRPRTR